MGCLQNRASPPVNSGGQAALPFAEPIHANIMYLVRFLTPCSPPPPGLI